MIGNVTLRNKITIIENQKFGILTVGPLITWVQQHPLYYTTSPSYLTHGRLRECYCECGNTILYSENALQTGNIKSCGCLKRKRTEEAVKARLEREKKNAHKREVNHRIRQAQAKLKSLQAQPVFMRDRPETQKEISEVGAELRKLFAMKAYANRKA